MLSLIAALQTAPTTSFLTSPIAVLSKWRMNVQTDSPGVPDFGPPVEPGYPTPHDAAIFGGVIAAIFGLYLAILVFTIVANYVIYGIALSMFFRKVGVEPWIGWIPVYGRWKWMEVGGQQGFWSLFVFVPGASIVAAVFTYIGMWRSNIAFRQSTGIFVLGIFFPFIWLFIMASRALPYEPDLIRQAGYGPPLAGYGANAWATPTSGQRYPAPAPGASSPPPPPQPSASPPPASAP